MTHKILPDSVGDAVSSLAGGRRVWVVGGAVRDRFLERPTDDYDFAVDGDAIALARDVADELDARYYTLDADRDTGRVLPEEEAGQWRRLDFAGLRAGSIEADLRARDFTVNAMALDLGAADRDLIDPTGGLQDLKDRRLRLCASDALERDPVRALRAVRLAAELGFQLDGSVVKAVAAARGVLEKASVERVRDELFHVLGTARPSRPLRVLRQLDLLQEVLPEIEVSGDAPGEVGGRFDLIRELQRLLAVIVGTHDAEAAADMTLGQASLRLGRFRERLEAELAEELSFGRSRRSLLVLAALYAGQLGDLPPEALPERARKLRLSGEEVQHLGQMSSWLRTNSSWLPAEAEARAIYRFYRALGAAGVEVVLLALSRFLSASTGPPDQDAWQREVERARGVLRPYFEGEGSILDPKPVVRGDELMEALGLEPGPQVGELLERIREEQAAGEVDSKEDALSFARSTLRGDAHDQG